MYLSVSCWSIYFETIKTYTLFIIISSLSIVHFSFILALCGTFLSEILFYLIRLISQLCFGSHLPDILHLFIYKLSVPSCFKSVSYTQHFVEFIFYYLTVKVSLPFSWQN